MKDQTESGKKVRRAFSLTGKILLFAILDTVVDYFWITMVEGLVIESAVAWAFAHAALIICSVVIVLLIWYVVSFIVIKIQKWFVGYSKRRAEQKKEKEEEEIPQ